MRSIPSPKDFISGLIFVAFGIAAIVLGSAYPLGTAARMGPRILGILLILLGAAIVVRALRVKGGRLPGWKWRPVLVVTVGVVLFGVLLLPLGLVLSTMILIVLASFASPEFRIKESLISGVVLAALCVGVFVIGLKLQLPIWPGQG
jgi:hypothetical protein